MLVPYVLLLCFLWPDSVAADSLVWCGWESSCNYAMVAGILVYFKGLLALVVAVAELVAYSQGDRDETMMDMFLGAN